MGCYFVGGKTALMALSNLFEFRTSSPVRSCHACSVNLRKSLLLRAGLATLEVPGDIYREAALGIYRGCSVELDEDDNVLRGLALAIDGRPAVAGLAPIGDRRG